MLTLTIKMVDENIKKVSRILRENSLKSLTITELVKVSGLSRHKVLRALSKLEGARKVSFRRVGMAKIYSLKK